MTFSKDSVDQFISQLSLVKYHTGSMGTFFLNFLMADDPRIKQLVFKKLFGRHASSEWASYSYNERIYSDQELIRLQNEIPEAKNLEELMFISAFMYNHSIRDLFQSKQIFYNYGTVYDRMVNLFSSFKTHVLENDLPSGLQPEIILPYLKCHNHSGDNEKHYDNLNVKQKIYCFFPKTKQWIPYILTIHKHIVFPLARKSSLSIKYMNHLLYNQKSDLIFNTAIDQPGYYNVDMYRLILTDTSKALSELEENILDFNCTDKKRSLVMIAKRDIMSTLGFYGLRSDKEFDLKNDFDSFVKAAPVFLDKVKASEQKVRTWII